LILVSFLDKNRTEPNLLTPSLGGLIEFDFFFSHSLSPFAFPFFSFFLSQLSLYWALLGHTRGLKWRVTDESKIKMKKDK